MTPDDLVLTPRGLRFRARTYPCSIGKGGISEDKREGDGATPNATMRVMQMFYRADRIAAPTPWAIPIGPRDLWSDDVKSRNYNHLVRAPYHFSHESLRRADPLYDLIITTDWNWPTAIPGKGSAIFIHQWRRPGFPTEGCVALSRRNLHQIAKEITPGTRLIISSFPNGEKS